MIFSPSYALVQYGWLVAGSFNGWNLGPNLYPIVATYEEWGDCVLGGWYINTAGNAVGLNCYEVQGIWIEEEVPVAEPPGRAPPPARGRRGRGPRQTPASLPGYNSRGPQALPPA